VHAAHNRLVSQAEANDLAEVVGVDARHHHGHEHDTQAGFAAVGDGALFVDLQGTTAHPLVDVVARAVELQEHGRDARGLEPPREVDVATEAQTVGVDLDER